ncbi:MAG: hypothetical protein AAFV54_02660 [Pseudomonadota bacterium]
MPNIPVEKLDQNGALTTHPFQYYPCVRLRFSFQSPVALPGGGHRINGLMDAVALIDTGADFNLIRTELIPTNLQPVETVNSLGVNGVTQERNYEVCLFIREADMVHNTGIVSWSPTNTPPYNMILGRKFLQMCRFEFDRHNGIGSLEFENNPNAV